jgi:hypothetical protein
MIGDQGDPTRPFNEIARNLTREHRSHRAPRHSRPRSLDEAARRLRWRWVLAVAIGLGLAVGVAFVIPT